MRKRAAASLIDSVSTVRSPASRWDHSVRCSRPDQVHGKSRQESSMRNTSKLRKIAFSAIAAIALGSATLSTPVLARGGGGGGGGGGHGGGGGGGHMGGGFGGGHMGGFGGGHIGGVGGGHIGGFGGGHIGGFFVSTMAFV